MTPLPYSRTCGFRSVGAHDDPSPPVPLAAVRPCSQRPTSVFQRRPALSRPSSSMRTAGFADFRLPRSHYLPASSHPPELPLEREARRSPRSSAYRGVKRRLRRGRSTSTRPGRSKASYPCAPARISSWPGAEGRIRVERVIFARVSTTALAAFRSPSPGNLLQSSRMPKLEFIGSASDSTSANKMGVIGPSEGRDQVLRPDPPYHGRHHVSRAEPSV